LLGDIPYATISTQGDFNPATGVFTPVGLTGPLSFPNLCCHKLEFNVPAGKYIIRIASHKATIYDSNFQQTSTYVAVLCRSDQLTASPTSRNAYASTPLKEIEIDCTNDNVVLNGFSGVYGGAGSDPVFVVLDLGQPLIAAAIDGYLYESATL